MLRKYTVYVNDTYRNKEFQLNIKAKSMLRAILVAEVVVYPKDLRDAPSNVYRVEDVACSAFDDTLLHAVCSPLGGDLEYTIYCDGNIIMAASQLTDYYYEKHNS